MIARLCACANPIPGFARRSHLVSYVAHIIVFALVLSPVWRPRDRPPPAKLGHSASATQHVLDIQPRAPDHRLRETLLPHHAIDAVRVRIRVPPHQTPGLVVKYHGRVDAHASRPVVCLCLLHGEAPHGVLAYVRQAAVEVHVQPVDAHDVQQLPRGFLRDGVGE
ncbi:hypothetical protein S40285_10575 [Stachybotrys chlorohalonatus IBT 40285]|uniref:Uncharacterized protein n=1 Tax=Stachybotrys chlorohalonatus (strain IBT 40285) TaxID=1283841 RepID=A0A084Q8I5_STAC4|nr:hypothetical protein S40285_10575 [Stachybotrys chlorohalonata IBT 40285]